MLSVAVDLHGEVEALAVGETQARLDCATDAEISTEPKHASAAGSRDVRGSIRRPVIDDDRFNCHIRRWRERSNLGEQPTEGFLLVERWHDDQHPHAQRAISRERSKYTRAPWCSSPGTCCSPAGSGSCCTPSPGT